MSSILLLHLVARDNRCVYMARVKKIYQNFYFKHSAHGCFNMYAIVIQCI